jgi:alpha-glucosidase (family GH31 glycosyl hydrolase)
MDVVNSAKKSLLVRYEILPYYYTLFYKAHLFGNTVIRPLFHEYPRDRITYSIDRQFLVGPAFLVTPVLDEGATSVRGYFPLDYWYSYYDGSLEAKNEQNSTWLDLDTPIDHIQLHIRGGYIIPTQQAANTTYYSRQNPFGLIIAPNMYGEAKGDLFYDDGDSDLSLNLYYYATFFLRDNQLKMNIEENNYSEMNKKIMNKIRIFVKSENKNINFLINKKQSIANENIEYKDNEIILNNLNLPMNESFEIEWSVETQFTQNSLGPIIDCSFEFEPLNETQCKNKGCNYLKQNDFIPSCFIPEDKGGYNLVK